MGWTSEKQYLLERKELVDFLSDSERDASNDAMAINYGYFAMNISSVHLFVKDLVNDKIIFNKPIAQSIINGLSFWYADTDKVYLLASSNDTQVYIYSLPEMKTLTVLKCGKRVNYSKISPNGNLIASACDNTTSIVLHQIRKNKDNSYTFTQLTGISLIIAPLYQKKITMNTNYGDSSMSVAWDTTSKIIGCGFESKMFHLYDVSSVKAPKLIYQFYGTTSIRGVKFSEVSSSRYMGFIESSKLVHILDLTTLQRQELDLKALGDDDSSISGISFSPDGKSVFVGTNKYLWQIPLKAGVRSLLDICVFFVKQNKKKWNEFGWNLKILPLDLMERIEY